VVMINMMDGFLRIYVCICSLVYGMVDAFCGFKYGLPDNSRRMMEDPRTAISSFLIESRSWPERAAQHHHEGTGRLLALFHHSAEAVEQQRSLSRQRPGKQTVTVVSDGSRTKILEHNGTDSQKLSKG